MMTPPTTREAAVRYVSQGFVLVEVPHGRKAPQAKDWQRNGIDDLGRARAVFAAPRNMGLLHSASGTGCLDLDDETAAREVFEAIGLNLDSYLTAKTPKIKGAKGVKPVFKMPKGVMLETKKLAWHYTEGDKRKAHTIFELRGAGGQDVLPPSLHPSGIHYEWVDGYPNSFDDFLELPSELLKLWENWDFYAPIMQSVSPYFKPVKQERKNTNAETNEIIEKFNHTVDIEDLLESYGYRRKGKKFVAPGSSSGLAGVVVLESDGKPVVYSHHGSDPLANGRSHDAFSVLQTLGFNGDFKVTMDEVRRRLGLGAFEPAKQSSQSQQAIQATPSNEATIIKLPYIVPVNHPEIDRQKMLHGLSGEVVEILEPATEADPVALLTSLLVSFGNAIGRGAYVSVGPVRHFANLFAVTVGATAKARKGTSIEVLKATTYNFAQDWANNCIASGLSSGEGLLSGFQSEDTTFVDKRLLVIEQEFAQTLKASSREGNTLASILRLAWDGSDLRVMTRKSPLKVTEPHLSLLGQITAAELQLVFSESDVFNGLGNRILWLAVARRKLLPFGASIDQPSLNSLISQLRTAYIFGKSAGEVTFAPEARDLWVQIYTELSQDVPGFIGALTARAEPQVLRLALIYALLDSSKVIKVEHLNVARAFWAYAEASVKYIFSERSGSPLEVKISEFLKAAPDGLTRTELSEALGRHERSKDIEAVLETLESEGKLERRLESTSGRSKQILVWNKDYAKNAN
jgi:hypothetical protein